MRALPNMKILNPASYSEAIKVIEYLCETELDSPHYLRLGRQPIRDIFEELPWDYTFEFGKGNEVTSGDDVTIFSTGCVLPDVLEAAEGVKQLCGKSVRVINIPTIKPIDKDIIIRAAEETDLLFSVEDHSIIGGLGSAVSEVLTEYSPSRLVRIGLNDEFPESGPPTDLYEKYGLSSSQISTRVIDELGR